jgi:UTP--glucose-1-phosphate uridylyltransferase
MSQVTIAVIPAAGFGTRFLPATKAIPKEMMPIVNRPAIQVIAEEAQASGITDFLLITGRNKGEIVDHFDRMPELEAVLSSKGKQALLDKTTEPVQLMNVSSVRQHVAKGLGHAVLRSRSLVGDRPFAVMLPDDLVQSDQPYLKLLLDAFHETGKGVLGLMEVPESEVSSYGIVEASVRPDGSYNISGMVEKPQPEDAPSRLAIVGRYVLPPRIFDMLEQTQEGQGGEIQLTDALQKLAAEEGMIGIPLNGVRHDTGNVVGYITANVAYGLAQEGIGDALRARLHHLLDESGA